jgi:hypothetical protein
MKRENNAQLSVPKQRIKYHEWVAREMKRRLKAEGAIIDKPPATWTWEYNGTTGEVVAHTRSEAKARVKEYLGNPNKPLPKEVELTCLN